MRYDIQRTNEPKLGFNGRLLNAVSGLSRVAKNAKYHRYFELYLYETINGQYVCHIQYNTAVEGEFPHSIAVMVAKEHVADAFRCYDPNMPATEGGDTRKLAEQYEFLVGELFGAVDDFTVELDSKCAKGRDEK